MHAQAILYDLFKRMLGSGPIYAALGNHDSYDQLVFMMPLTISS
jgi:sphingomyelin phosphodiesterase